MKSLICCFVIIVLLTAVACSAEAYSLECDADAGMPGAFALDAGGEWTDEFGEAVETAVTSVMRANCFVPHKKNEKPEILLVLKITGARSNRKANPVGMLLAGGISSATELNVAIEATLTARSGGKVIFRDNITYRNSPQELFSGWIRSRAIKKRAIENAAKILTVRLVKELGGDSASPVRPPRKASDLLTDDSDIWPVLKGGFTSIGLHEAGHAINARLLGHDVEFRGNDSRTFRAGPDMTLGLSLLFAHRTGEDMLLPLLPDVTYDFEPRQTPSGDIVYVNENGAPVSNGPRDSALLSYSGILYQNIASEYILTKHPRLIDEDRPFLKGMVLMNLFLPAFYTVKGYDDPNSDLLRLQSALGADRWQINTMVMLPAAIDFYRYYHPEKKKLRRYSRIAKLIPLIICLAE